MRRFARPISRAVIEQPKSSGVMEDLLGTTWHVSLLITVVIMGFAAFMTGQALGANWRPLKPLVFFGILLGLADRFLIFALFQGALLSVTGYVIDTAYILIVALIAYRLTRAKRMITQYPWVYERAGPFGWREKR